MPTRGDVRGRFVFTCRFLFIAICCAMCGASLSGLLLSSVNAQSQTVVEQMEKRASDQNDRLFRQESSLLLLTQKIAVLESDGTRRDILIDDMRNQIAAMHGGALAVGGILAVLMFLQMFFGRRRQGS